MANLLTVQGFHAPPVNIEEWIENRPVYRRANMEFVAGILGVSNGGTGSTSFTENNLVAFSGGKLMSTTVTKDDLEAITNTLQTNNKLSIIYDETTNCVVFDVM